MFRVSILYPNEPGKKFDWDHYINKHMVLAQERLEPFGLVRTEVDKAVTAEGPGASPFIGAGHLYFDSVEDFQKGFAEHGAEFMADMPNYTDIMPQIQISEIVK